MLRLLLKQVNPFFLLRFLSLALILTHFFVFLVRSQPKPKSSSKHKKKQPRISEAKPPRHHYHSSLRPLEYSPFTVWPWPYIHSPSPSHTSGDAGSTGINTTDENNIIEGHPFLLAREIFLRLVWAHVETLNGERSFDNFVNLHTLASHPPARLPPQALARLIDPDGDELGHLGGLPKWFGVLEGMLKRRFGLGLGAQGGAGTSAEGKTRAEVVDAVVFGYTQKHPSSLLPKLTPTAFHQYILLLGLSAPEPWDFVQCGWNLYQHPFDGYASTPSDAAAFTLVTGVPPSSSGSRAPFSRTKDSKIATANNTVPIIPGVSEIPLTLSYMRSLRLIPTRDTICAAIVFWKEAVGGESLLQIGVNHFGIKGKLGRLGIEVREEESESDELDAYEREYEVWNLQGESREEKEDEIQSGGGRGRRVRGEYAKFCRWIREWVDEVNINNAVRVASKDGPPELKLAMTMPHPYHIQRWAGIIRKMREGQGYEESQDGEKDEEIEEGEKG